MFCAMIFFKGWYEKIVKRRDAQGGITNNKTQQNSKYRLCGDREETINHIISECSKLAQKEYKTRHDWEGKVIHGELCKKLKFDHMNKWYIQNPISVL